MDKNNVDNQSFCVNNQIEQKTAEQKFVEQKSIPPNRVVPNSVSRKYGLIAGWGQYPVLLAQAIKNEGHQVVCLGALNHADPILQEICDVYQTIGIAKFGKACRFFRKHGIQEATMAGKIHKRLLLQSGYVWRQLPDLYTLRCFIPQFITRKKDCKDDSLLLTVVNAFERKGIHLLPGTDFAPELLVKRKNLSRKTPARSQWKDICFGWTLAREMGRLDVGQSVCVRNSAVLSVEAVEGTDESIRRAGLLCQKSPFVVVKVAKPNQDMRFDVPTVGLQTLQTMLESGADVLVIEANKTILLEEEAVIRFADQHKMILVALSDDDLLRKESDLNPDLNSELSIDLNTNFNSDKNSNL